MLPLVSLRSSPMAASSCCSCAILRCRAAFSFFGVARVELQPFALRRKPPRRRIERQLAAPQLLLFGPHLFGEAPDVAQLAFAHRRHGAQVGDPAGRVGEVARREDIGQVVVVAIVAVGFADHRGVLFPVAFERRRESSRDAVLACDLLAQQRRLLLGGVEQLGPRVDLAGQPADTLLGARAALPELRNLPLLGGDPFLEGGDDPLLLPDLRVVLGPGPGDGEREQERRKEFSDRLHRFFASGSGFAACCIRGSISSAE